MHIYYSQFTYEKNYNKSVSFEVWLKILYAMYSRLFLISWYLFTLVYWERIF